MLKNLRQMDIKLTREATMDLRFYGSLFILLLISLFLAERYVPLLESRKDFFNELWAPTNLLVHGKSPYNTSAFHPISPAAWLPMAIGAFFPLGWLRDDIALHSWFVLSVFALYWIIFLVQGKFQSIYISLIVGTMVLYFPPTLYHLILGQFSIITTICSIVAVYQIQKKREWLAAFLLAVALSKPQLVTLVMIGLSIYYFQTGRLKALLWFWTRILLMILVLCVPLFIAYPNWIPDMIISMRANPFWSYPTLFILFQIYLGRWGLVLWGIVVVAVIFINVLIWKRLNILQATYWSFGLAPLITPYIGSWDFVIVLPVFIFTFSQVEWRKKILLIMTYLVAWYEMALIQNLKESHNYYFWWVPVWFMAIVAITTNWKTSHIDYQSPS